MFCSTSYSASIKFFNGFSLQESNLDPKGPPGKNYKLIDPKTLEVFDEFDANRGYIKKTYYSSDNKEIVAVVITESDGGSGGFYYWDTLIYATENFLKREKFSNLIEVDMDVEGSHIKKLLITEQVLTTNSLGDETKIEKVHHIIKTKNSKTPHIVEYGMKQKYANLLEMYAWDYLGSDDYRSSLLKEIGIKKFKEFRDIITIGGPGELVKRRFVILEGYQKIYWENFAIIIVDGFTGEEVAIRYDNKFNGEIIDSKPFNKIFHQIFPLKRRNPFSNNSNECIIFNSEGSDLSIELVKNCSL